MKLTYRPPAPCPPGCAHAAMPSDPPAPCDRAFIAATWSAYWRRPPEASCLSPTAWRSAVWQSVPGILERNGMRALVAADADTTDGLADLFGWIVWKPRAVECVMNKYTRRPMYNLVDGGPMPLVFFVFVKAAYHRLGIARGLFRAAGIDARADFAYACHARAASDLSNKIPNAEWCPKLGRLPAQERNHGQPRPEEPDADAA